MKNFYFFESQSLVIDTISSNEWITTMTQLMKLAGNNLYEHSIDVALLTATMALTSNQELLSDISMTSITSLASLRQPNALAQSPKKPQRNWDLQKA